MFTSLTGTRELDQLLKGHYNKGLSNDLKLEFTGLNRVTANSKLVREDEDIRALKFSETNALYRYVLTVQILADANEREAYDDPVTFIVMAGPRFKSATKDKFKIVCNPNTTSRSRLEQFLLKLFPKKSYDSKTYWQQFRLGRVDFNVDTTDYTVDELYRSVTVTRSLAFSDGYSVPRKTVSVGTIEDVDCEGGNVRVFSATNRETVYIGKGRFVVRIYDKVAEAKHQIQVCKQQNWNVPQRLLDIVNENRRVRIEYQIRDLGRSGYRSIDPLTGEEVEPTDENAQRVFVPTRGFHYLRSLGDIWKLKPEWMDMFNDLHFGETFELEGDDWKAEAFLSLVHEHGLDTALKKLPRATRSRYRAELRTKDFPIDLNKQCYAEIQRWLNT